LEYCKVYFCGAKDHSLFTQSEFRIYFWFILQITVHFMQKLMITCFPPFKSYIPLETVIGL
jgi:hypothetical protein